MRKTDVAIATSPKNCTLHVVFFRLDVAVSWLPHATTPDQPPTRSCRPSRAPDSCVGRATRTEASRELNGFVAQRALRFFSRATHCFATHRASSASGLIGGSQTMSHFVGPAHSMTLHFFSICASSAFDVT